jgi:hypothetical protein
MGFEEEKSNEKEDYDLKKSVEMVGALVPILKSKRGEIIDGNTRLEKAPDAFKGFEVIIERIDTPAKEAIARLVSNFCRRKMKVEERTFMLDMVARETGWDAQTIANNTGISVYVVRRFLSPEFKQRDKAHRESLIETESEEPEGNGSVESGQLSTSGTPQKGVPTKEPVRVVMKEREICPNCGLGIDFPKDILINGKPVRVCMDCEEEFRITGTLNMLHLDEEPSTSEETQQPLAPYSSQIPAVKMEQPVKEATMIEIRVAKHLTDLGIGFEFQKAFTMPATVPTLYFPRQNVAIWLERATTDDVSVKKTREDLVRGIWERLYNGKAITIRFEGQTAHEAERVWAKVAEALGIKDGGKKEET